MRTLNRELLDEIVRRLVAEFQPEKIYLFGSHAWGTPTEDSDVDLCVVVPESGERPVQRAIRAQRCLDGMGLAKDILVKTRAEFDRYRSVYASLEAQIRDQGRLLYG
jgi:predicted nucleotidyltransferase